MCVLGLLLGSALFAPLSMLGNFGDIYAYHYPLQHLTAAGLQSGRLPFWNPYIFAGIPLLGNSQTAVFYPLAILFRVFPLGYAFTLYAAAHLALAGIGMHLWLRANRLDASMACLFSAAYCLSPFLIFRIAEGIPTLLASLAYVPWCWLALRSGRPGFLGAAWALQFLSGHPQFAMINALGMAGWCAWEFAQSRYGAARIMVREGAIAFALCLIQIIPMAEFILQSNRGGIPESFKNAYSIPPAAFATLVAPGFFGDPLGGDFVSVPSVFFEMYTLYLGWIPLGLALYGLAVSKGRPTSAVDAKLGWALAFVGAFLALGGHNPLIGWLAGVPVVGLSRVPARYGLLIVWGLLLAASAGWLRLRQSRRVAPGLKAILVAVLLFDLGLRAGRYVYAENPGPYLSPASAIVKNLGGRPVRFASSPDLANPNKAMLYRAMNVNGYDAFYLESFTRYAARSERGPAGDPSRTYIRRVDSPEMARLGVAYYLTPEKREGDFIPVGGQMRLYRQRGAGPLATLADSGKATYKRVDTKILRPEHWLLSGTSPSPGARLILSVPNYPGWRAFVNGKRTPIEVEDGLVQAVSLSAGGPFQVDFLFRPTGWPLLCALGAIAWMFWFRLVLRKK